MTDPVIDIELPTNDSPGQVIAATITMLRRLGQELGSKYDAFMQPHFGEGWLEALRQERIEDAYADGVQVPVLYKHPLNLNDPQFCLNEPIHNEHSPLRDCLGYTALVHDLFKRAREIRNRNQHFDEFPTLERLRTDAVTIGRLALEVGLPMTSATAELVQRVNGMITGAFEPADTSSAALAAEIEAEKAKAQQLAEAIAELRQQLRDDQVQGAATAAETQAALDAAETARVIAEEKYAEAQAALEHRLAEERSAALPDTSGLVPGDTWPTAPPARILRLLPFTGDLFDPADVDLLSNTVGDAASAAAAKWLESLPNGGIVHLSDAGEAVALLGATWTFLGRIDDPAAS